MGHGGDNYTMESHFYVHEGTTKKKNLSGVLKNFTPRRQAPSSTQEYPGELGRSNKN